MFILLLPVHVMRFFRKTPSWVAPSFSTAAMERVLRVSTRNSTLRQSPSKA